MGKTDDITEIQVDCSCGVEIMKITKWHDEDEYFISLYYHQPPMHIYRQLWERIKFAVRVMIGKDHCISELVLEEKDIRKLAKELQEHLEVEEFVNSLFSEA